MPQKRHTVDQIVAKLRKADVELGKGKKVPEICKLLEVTEQTYYRWRQKYGGMKPEMAKQLKALEKENAIKAQGYSVTNEAHGLWGGGARYFGLLELVGGGTNDDYSLVLGLRNSHDKTFPASLALGSQVLVCDNLSFFGEVVLTRRHTRFIERDLPGIVAQAVGRLSEMRTQQADRIDAYKQTRIRDRTAHDLMVRAVDSRVIPVTQLPLVLKEWREPSHDEFTENGRSVWRLFNAFTESFKTRSLEMLPRRSQALHGLMDSVCQLAA